MAEIRGKGGNGNCLIQQINYCVEDKSILRGENFAMYNIKGGHGYHVHTHGKK